MCKVSCPNTTCRPCLGDQIARVRQRIHELVGWLVGCCCWLVGSGRLAIWLAGRCVVGLTTDLQVGWFVGSVVGWLVGQLDYWLAVVGATLLFHWRPKPRISSKSSEEPSRMTITRSWHMPSAQAAGLFEISNKHT